MLSASFDTWYIKRVLCSNYSRRYRYFYLLLINKDRELKFFIKYKSYWNIFFIVWIDLRADINAPEWLFIWEFTAQNCR